MNNDIKSGVGYIIPLAAIIGFFTALFLGEYILSVLVAIAGILVWFLYMVVMESSPPSNLGNLIIFFGILLSIGVFMGFGVTQNMWGGIEFVSEGSLFALVVFFFSILTGLLFRNQPIVHTAGSNNNLTDQEKQWIQNALNENNVKSDINDSKVIVVKHENSGKEQEASEKEPVPKEEQYSNPYVYAYPPEYYYDEEYDDEYDEEYDEE
tara:strand:+ start:15 stop:641 length:627 start_codon:yes stop_codon:yes gene_type:complete